MLTTDFILLVNQKNDSKLTWKCQISSIFEDISDLMLCITYSAPAGGKIQHFIFFLSDPDKFFSVALPILFDEIHLTGQLATALFLF